MNRPSQVSDFLEQNLKNETNQDVCSWILGLEAIISRMNENLSNIYAETRAEQRKLQEREKELSKLIKILTKGINEL